MDTIAYPNDRILLIIVKSGGNCYEYFSFLDLMQHFSALSKEAHDL